MLENVRELALTTMFDVIVSGIILLILRYVVQNQNFCLNGQNGLGLLANDMEARAMTSKRLMAQYLVDNRRQFWHN